MLNFSRNGIQIRILIGKYEENFIYENEAGHDKQHKIDVNSTILHINYCDF